MQSPVTGGQRPFVDTQGRPVTRERRPAGRLSTLRLSTFPFCTPLAFSLGLFLLLLAGCGAPSEPMPPMPKIPEAVADLEAEQSGDRVILAWTPPVLETSGARLEQPPQYEIYRAFFQELATAEKNFTQVSTPVLTVPATLADTFLEAGRLRVPDPLGAQAASQHAGELVVYAVKALNRKGQNAGFSKLAAVRIYPSAAAPRGVHADVKEDAIELAWQAPTTTTAGTAIPSLAGYRIYRSPTGAKGSFVRAGSSAAANFRDTQFEFGKTYYYFVRALAQYGADVVESAESETVKVTPEDRFPPRSPTGLVAIAVPGSIELSWNPSPERDLAGYIIHRRDADAQAFRRLNQELAKTPTFRDASVEKGKRYVYAVTAVDTSGNESTRSEEVSETAE